MCLSGGPHAAGNQEHGNRNDPEKRSRSAGRLDRGSRNRLVGGPTGDLRCALPGDADSRFHASILRCDPRLGSVASGCFGPTCYGRSRVFLASSRAVRGLGCGFPGICCLGCGPRRMDGSSARELHVTPGGLAGRDFTVLEWTFETPGGVRPLCLSSAPGTIRFTVVRHCLGRWRDFRHPLNPRRARRLNLPPIPTQAPSNVSLIGVL